MKACASCSGGVMFVPETVERSTNKSRNMPRSYKDIAGEDSDKAPLREKIFGIFKINNKKAKVA